MMKRALVAGIGLVGVSLSALGQEGLTGGSEMSEPLRGAKEFSAASTLVLDQPGRFYTVDSSELVRGLPIRAFMDRSQIDLTNGVDLPPIAYVSAVNAQTARRQSSAKEDLPEGALDQRLSRVYTSGEVGFFYGKSMSRHSGGDDFGGYIIGTVGTDKIQITAGASYEESNFRIPRFGR